MAWIIRTKDKFVAISRVDANGNWNICRIDSKKQKEWRTEIGAKAALTRIRKLSVTAAENLEVVQFPETSNDDYPFIRAWGRMLCSLPGYVEAEVAEAKQCGAPLAACYHTSEGGWQTFEQIESEETKSHLREILDKHFGGFEKAWTAANE